MTHHPSHQCKMLSLDVSANHEHVKFLGFLYVLSQHFYKYISYYALTRYISLCQRMLVWWWCDTAARWLPGKREFQTILLTITRLSHSILTVNYLNYAIAMPEGYLF